jgi:hypothetical protein
MIPYQNPPAIVEIDGRGTYETAGAAERVSADIPTIQRWLECETELAAVRRLGNNWDGFDSDAPNPSALARADLFLRILRDRGYSNPPRRITISPNGAVAFEWLEGASFIRAEIENSDDIEWMIATPGQPTEFAVETIIEPSETQTEGTWQPAPLAVGV